MERAFDAREARLLNDYQHRFPLVHEPYACIADDLRTDERWVRERLARWQADGRVSRVGAVFRPHTIGVSTLVALAVPEHELERVATRVSRLPEVNHNYEREHRFNLWCVVNAPDAAALDAALHAIRRDTGLAPLSLPLVADYWIDLGFDLDGCDDGPRGAIPANRAIASPIALSDTDRRVIAALEPGLQLCPAPYASAARCAGVGEADVIDRLSSWLDSGVVKRLGVVLRHRELGFTANAMCVWDVPDADVDRIGETVARESRVSLCYRRERSRPEWPFNLYCMVHGCNRAQVEHAVADIAAWHGLDQYPAAVLFSRRRFKQRGARYFAGAAGDTARRSG